VTKLRVFQGTGAFDRATAEKGEQVVCGVVMKDGSPAYFLADPEIQPKEVQEAAFRIREGRPMREGEREFIDAVHRHQARKDYP
jgi:hypothetical protein